MRKQIWMALGVAAVLLLPTWAPAAAAAEPPPASSIVWHNCAPPPLDIPDGGQKCGEIDVPLNYQDPRGTHIEVAVSRIAAANPTKRRGVLLVNPGGPGGSGLDLPRELSLLMDSAVLDAYDIVGFDPRGVGQSTPLTCGLTALQANQALPPLMQDHRFSATATFVHQVADQCAVDGGQIMPYMNTANTARDMDQIRRALGEPKISYLGYSYGTYLGMVYAMLFSQHTDRMVIDSNVDPDWTWREQFNQWGPAGAARFPDFARFAAANDATLHLGATPAAVTNKYYQLSNQLAAHPLMLPDGTILNDAFFCEVVFSSLYSDSSFPFLAMLWQELSQPVLPGGAAIQNTLGGLVGPRPLAGGPTPPLVPVDNPVASGLAVLCNDVAWPRNTAGLPDPAHNVASYELDLGLSMAAYPMFGALGRNIWPCAYWKSPPVEPSVQISGTGPRNILMIQNVRDPATAYSGAVEARQLLGHRASLVTVQQGGHGAAYLTLSQCASDAATRWLVNGLMPPPSGQTCPPPGLTASPHAALSSEAPTRGAVGPAATSARTTAIRLIQEVMRPRF
ncbi:MAG TPA: alpha/beta hydrolase [Candidatus Saccharimonadia bacterium]|nr:alpha/beta hydrolase [Candidatus Saccharimonadia bacterium]